MRAFLIHVEVERHAVALQGRDEFQRVFRRQRQSRFGTNGQPARQHQHVGFPAGFHRLEAGSLQPGALVALANALTVALSILLVRRLSDSESPLMILTQFALWSTLLLAVPAIWVWRWPDAWGWTLAIGVAASATVGQYFWVQAFKAGEMSAVAPFEYLRLPFAVFMGWLIWGQMPEIWTYVGAAIVIASALYIAQREAQLARERRKAALKGNSES